MAKQSFAVYRHELKYLLSPTEYYHLRTLLGSVLQRDSYGAGGDYYIRSLYFDTLDDRDFEEKLLGISERRKIRLRVYSMDEQNVKLEVKNKRDGYSVKETAILRREDALALVQGQTDVLLNYDNPVAREVYRYFKQDLHHPTALIDYEREAFLSPVENIRLTFDKNIRAAKCDRLFDPDAPMIPLHSPLVTVLEVKYDNYLPHYITQLLSGCCMQNMSVSKYCTARTMIY